MRKLQVNALLKHAHKDYIAIEKQYNDALEEQNISATLQIDIKNYMENLRSVLDYIAHDIYENILIPQSITIDTQRIKFPYGRTQNDFRSQVQSTLRDINIHGSHIFSLIEECQPFQSGDNWLIDFCEIVNQKKHDTLTPQVRKEKRSINIQFQGGASIEMGTGASISGSGIIQSGANTIILNNDFISGDSPAQHATGGVQQTVTRWVSFHFSGTGIEVLPFLKKVLYNIKSLVDHIYENIT